MNGQIVHLDPDPHAAVQRLLPWYVTQRLDADERAEVDAHLAACPACRAELETERQWQCLQPGDAALVDVEHGWAAMRARLGEAGAPHGPGRDDESDAVPSSFGRGEARAAAPRGFGRADDLDSGFGSARPRRRPPAPWPRRLAPLARVWGAPALLSAALVVALVATWRPAADGAATGEYRALAAAPTDGATAVVRFRPDATEAEIRRSLNDSGARLVDGPTVTDAYVVRLPREHYAAALARLRREPAVALVEALESASP